MVRWGQISGFCKPGLRWPQETPSQTISRIQILPKNPTDQKLTLKKTTKTSRTLHKTPVNSILERSFLREFHAVLAISENGGFSAESIQRFDPPAYLFAIQLT